MRLAIVTALWKREALAREMLLHHAALRGVLAADGIELDLVAVGSEGAASRDLADACGWRYREFSNDSLSDKWNCGVGATFEFEGAPDGVVILGSDDFADAQVFRTFAGALQRGVQYAGFTDGFAWRAADGRALRQWFDTRRSGEPLGAGRLLGRDLVEDLGWEPWPRGLAKGLDRSMASKILSLTIQPVKELFVCGAAGRLLDVRLVDDDVNMTGWDRTAEAGEDVPEAVALEGFPAATVARLRALADPVAPCRPLFRGRDVGDDVCATLIVKNESVRLRKCLESVAAVVPEALVLDTGSNDRTIDVANACGARVERYDGAASGLNFSEWRNCVLWIARSAGFRRVLMIDADQVLADPGDLAAVLRSDAPAASVRIDALTSSGGSESWRSVQVLDPAKHWFEYPVHNQLRGYAIEDVAEISAVFTTSYHHNVRGKARRSMPALRRFIREHPANAHGYFYAARHAKTLGWTRLAHRMNKHVVAIAPGDPSYASAWSDLAISTVILEGVEPAEAVIERGKKYHPAFEEIWRVAVALDGVRWTESAHSPGVYAFLPRAGTNAAKAFPRVAEAIGLPLWWHRPSSSE